MGRAESVDAVLILGDRPRDAQAWDRSGPLRATAVMVAKAAAEQVPVLSVGSGSAKGGRGGVGGGSARVRWLARELLKLPAPEPGAAAARWRQAAAAAGADQGEDLLACLARWPELRVARDGEGRTLLQVAAGSGSTEAVRVLLRSGAAWHLQDAREVSAGQAALAAGHQATFDLLVEHGCAAERRQRSAREDGAARPAKRQRGEQLPYLEQRLTYEDGKLLDAGRKGVMMGWEGPLMAKHAQAMLPAPGAAVLNVGFGLGLVDGFIQDLRPKEHHIIEAHPDVRREMERRGWCGKEGVKVHGGRWQDVLASLPERSLDAVYFDTWDETYVDLREFMEHLPRLLRPGGRFSFFNGLAPYNIFFHAVYCRMAQADLEDLGLTCDLLAFEMGGYCIFMTV